jgi:hypothetical protein
MRCDCEECGDRQACDIYYNEIGYYQLLQASHEEDWHEKRHAEKEGL